MKVLITGGTGFLGKHVEKILGEKGHAPYVCGSGSDLRSLDMASEVFYASQPEAVVHLACPMGGGNVLHAGLQEANLLRDMLLINTNVLEKCMRLCVKHVITIGSVCEYPDDDTPAYLGGIGPWTPKDLWEGLPHFSHRAYGLAKRMLAEQGRTYASQYGMNVTHLILSNLYGPGDKLNHFSHFIPSTIKKMLENPEVVEVWGNGEPRRQFLYVEDAALEIVHHVEEQLPGHSIFNLCPSDDISIAGVVELLREHVPFTGRVLWDHLQPNGQMHRLMERTLAPIQETPFEEGLKRTIDWIRKELA